MIRAIGLIELNSIARGMEVTDVMLKTANVEIIISSSTCPGKYIALVHGDISAVENSIKSGKLAGKECVIDDLIIPNVDEQIFPAITQTTDVKNIKALGVIESFSIASMILATDTCVKTANVKLLEIRLGSGIGGKSYVVMTGDVAEVKASVEAGVNLIKPTSNLVNYTIISSPHEDFKKLLL